jgi:hypothetical protein
MTTAHKKAPIGVEALTEAAVDLGSGMNQPNTRPNTADDAIAARAARQSVRDRTNQCSTRARLEAAEREPNGVAPHRLHAAKQLQADLLVVAESAWRLTDREDSEQDFAAREHRASVEVLLDYVCAQQLVPEINDFEAAALRSSARKFCGALQARFLTKLRALQRDPLPRPGALRFKRQCAGSVRGHWAGCLLLGEQRKISAPSEYFRV